MNQTTLSEDTATPRSDMPWPGALPSGQLKRFLKVMAGRLVTLLQPGQAARVRAADCPETLSRLQRLILAAWVHRCERRDELGALAPWHRWVWQHQAAVSHHAAFDDRFTVWWEFEHHKIVPAVQQAAEGSPHRFTSLVEIGCGAGRAMHHFDNAFPALERLVGIDLSNTQVEQNRQNFADRGRVEFVCADANAWIAQHASPGTIYITVAGVLEYFSPTELDSLLQTIRDKKPCVLALIEPLPPAYDDATASQAVPYNMERSLAHPYRRMLTEAGFEITWHADVDVGGRWCMLVARTPART